MAEKEKKYIILWTGIFHYQLEASTSTAPFQWKTSGNVTVTGELCCRVDSADGLNIFMKKWSSTTYQTVSLMVFLWKKRWFTMKVFLKEHFLEYFLLLCLWGKLLIKAIYSIINILRLFIVGDIFHYIGIIPSVTENFVNFLHAKLWITNCHSNT